MKTTIKKIYLNAGRSKRGNNYIVLKTIDSSNKETSYFITKSETNKNGEIVAYDDGRNVFIKKVNNDFLCHIGGVNYTLTPNKYGWAWSEPIDTSEVDEIIQLLGLTPLESQEIEDSEETNDKNAENDDEEFPF
jgi:hypothetical protein